jgi:Cu(I)/Ag(I) efflux system membrane fusion protein
MKRCIFLVLIGSLSTALWAQHDHAAPQPKPKASAPKKQEGAEEGRVPVKVPEAQQQKMGLKVTQAKVQDVQYTIRTIGTIAVDQSREAHVHTKIRGWIEKLYADSVGKSVKKGQPLYELYSPELVSTQEEYLAARQQGVAGSEIARASLERLRLWGVSEQSIRQLQQTGRSQRALLFTSPVDGFVINKTAIQGMYVGPELELYHIADLSKIWVMLTLYEYDVAAIRVGDDALITLPYNPAARIQSKITYIYPEIDPETRTARARIEIQNPDQNLKPGMFVNAEIQKNLGRSIVIPDDAVIDTGKRNIVFIRQAGGVFEPREITVGPRIQQQFVVLSGLKENEELVVSAHFLIDAESKFQAAIQRGQSNQAGHGSHGGK